MNNLFINGLITQPNLFLIVLGFIWICIAVFQDLKKREIANWVNFSLLIFAMVYRLFYSVLSKEAGFFVFGLLGVGIFFLLGNLFYYSRLFAGGDAKLLFSLGAILPLTNTLKENLGIFFLFILLLFFTGAVYSLIYSLFIVLFNKNRFKKEIVKNIKKNKILICVMIIFAIVLLLFSYFWGEISFLFLSLMFFLFGFIYIYGKTLEEILVKEIRVGELTEGDWLYRDIVIGKGKSKKVIKSEWDGVDKKEIEKIKKHLKKIKIKQGIPFTPAFLLAFILLFWLWNSYWELIFFFI